MNKFNRLLAAAALLVASTSAGASEFHVSVPGNGNLTNNNPGGSGFAPVAVTGYTGVGGQFAGNFWTGAGAAPADSFLRYFCIELGEYANGGPNLYASSILTNDNLRKLYDVAYPNSGAGDFWNGAQTNFGVFADSTSAAAFQVAVWNLTFDGDLSLTAGSFQWTGASSAVSTAAQSLLTQVGSYAGTGYTNWTLYRFVSPAGCVTGALCERGYQNYVSATREVPEPGTLALLGLALAGMGAVGRRRRA
jgi:hypothetical protein